MKLSNFLNKENHAVMSLALMDFMNAKLLSVRANANEKLVVEFCNQTGLVRNSELMSRSEITITFPDIEAVKKLQADLKIPSHEALTPVLINKNPELVEISLLVL